VVSVYKGLVAMYLKRTKTANGRTYMAITQSYRDSHGAPRSRTVKSLGYLDELEKKHDDAIDYCMREKKRLENEYAHDKIQQTVLLDPNKRLQTKSLIRKNMGFYAYRTIYRELGLDVYLKRKATRAHLDAPFDKIIECLLYIYLGGTRDLSRVWSHKDDFLVSFDFTYSEMIAALDFAALIDTDIHLWLVRHVEKMGILSDSTGYLAIVNFYCDKVATDATPNEFQYFDSMVQVGMLFNQNRFPVSYSVFFGSDYQNRLRRHVNPAYVLDLLTDHHPTLKKIVVIADKGASASDETIAQITKKGDYLFGLLPTECAPETRRWMMSPDGYDSYGDDSYRSKQRLITRRVEIGRGKYISRRILPERQIALWSKRQEGMRRTLRAPTTASVFESPEIDWLTDSNEFSGNWADGYRLLVTSQTQNSIIQNASIYQLLHYTKEIFEPSAFETQKPLKDIPWEKQVKAHCLLCYIADLLASLLSFRTDGLYSASQITHSLARANGTEIENGWYAFDYYDKVLEAISNTTEIDYGKKYMSEEEIKRLLAKPRNKSNFTEHN
jgi:hypothetical protein